MWFWSATEHSGDPATVVLGRAARHLRDCAWRNGPTFLILRPLPPVAQAGTAPHTRH